MSYLTYSNCEKDLIYRWKIRFPAQPSLKTRISHQAINNTLIRLRWKTSLVCKALTAMLNIIVLPPYKTIAISPTAFQNIKFSVHKESQILSHKKKQLNHVVSLNNHTIQWITRIQGWIFKIMRRLWIQINIFQFALKH